MEVRLNGVGAMREPFKLKQCQIADSGKCHRGPDDLYTQLDDPSALASDDKTTICFVQHLPRHSILSTKPVRYLPLRFVKCINTNAWRRVSYGVPFVSTKPLVLLWKVYCTNSQENSTY